MERDQYEKDVKKYWYEQNLTAAFEDMEEEESCEEETKVGSSAGVKRMQQFGPPCVRKARRTEGDDGSADEGGDDSATDEPEAKATKARSSARPGRTSARDDEQDVEDSNSSTTSSQYCHQMHSKAVKLKRVQFNIMWYSRSRTMSSRTWPSS